MEVTTENADRTHEITELFKSTFTASEGAVEAELISNLVKRMLVDVDPQDIFVFSALQEAKVVGAIIFSRLNYPEDTRTAFILSPVAVATARQGKGVGQKLINHGLSHLQDRGVDVVLSYGDINFYSKVGFAQISQDLARPPLPLSYPEGWIGQLLAKGSFCPLAGSSYCVEPLNDPAYW